MAYVPAYGEVGTEDVKYNFTATGSGTDSSIPSTNNLFTALKGSALSKLPWKWIAVGVVALWYINRSK